MFKKMIKIVCLMALISYGMSACGESKSSDDYARNRSVKIFNPKVGSCSGVQVRAPSGIDYILSAGHCKNLADSHGNFEIELESGKVIKRHLIAEDMYSDLLLIEGAPKLEGLNVADKEYRLEHVRTFTHGKGYDTYKTEGALMQMTRIQIALQELTDENLDKLDCFMPKHKIVTVDNFLFGKVTYCVLDVQEVVMTAKIVPGSSGGMIVDNDGRLIGIASATDGVFGFIVSLHDIKGFLAGY